MLGYWPSNWKYQPTLYEVATQNGTHIGACGELEKMVKILQQDDEREMSVW